MIGIEDVQAAARRIEGVAHRTPVLTSRALDEATGAQVFLKAENLQRIGAFKFRGAYNAVASLTDDERAAGVATASSGNHAQALALAARLHGARATILMPEDAPREQARRHARLRRRGGPASTATPPTARSCSPRWSPSAARSPCTPTTTRA